jgi:hypothetical protein
MADWGVVLTPEQTLVSCDWGVALTREQTLVSCDWGVVLVSGFCWLWL